MADPALLRAIALVDEMGLDASLLAFLCPVGSYAESQHGTTRDQVISRQLSPHSVSINTDIFGVAPASLWRPPHFLRGMIPLRNLLSSPCRLKDVVRIWRQNGSPGTEAAKKYLLWMHRFAAYCCSSALDQRRELTDAGVARFSKWWQRRSRRKISFRQAYSALHAWATALSMLGEPMPEWKPKATLVCEARLQPFVEYLRGVRGNSTQTIRITLSRLDMFERYRKAHGSGERQITLSEIDNYITACGQLYAKQSIAALCSAIRAYLRFLHVTGASDVDLAASVIAPTVRVAEEPYRTLPWNDVQRILESVESTRPDGMRDYALLLMMSIYGLGASDVIRLRLDDVNWRTSTLKVRRQKTKAEFLLPLLPSIGQALADYLMHGRHALAVDRELFLGTRTPYKRLSGAQAVRKILHKAARRAGVTSSFLGTHVLRHTHATREMELGTPFKLIGDILGHRNPKSTSVYTRVPSDRLRDLSLPVPK